MHSEAKCKAPIRCRNCGGPHRSDSWLCEARANKFGPVKKEQLAIIRKVEQKRLADYARIKAAAEIVCEAIYGLKKDAYMPDRSGCGILESKEEV